jgi:hypothetical protein
LFDGVGAALIAPVSAWHRYVLPRPVYDELSGEV